MKSNQALKRNVLITLACISGLLISCTIESPKENNLSLFETKQEAEKAGENFFDCFGSHKIGDKWAPCDEDEGHDHHH